jgi:hypothetical protein
MQESPNFVDGFSAGCNVVVIINYCIASDGKLRSSRKRVSKPAFEKFNLIVRQIIPQEVVPDFLNSYGKLFNMWNPEFASSGY